MRREQEGCLEDIAEEAPRLVDVAVRPSLGQRHVAGGAWTLYPHGFVAVAAMRQGRRGALFGDDGGAPGTSSSQRAVSAGLLPSPCCFWPAVAAPDSSSATALHSMPKAPSWRRLAASAIPLGVCQGRAPCQGPGSAPRPQDPESLEKQNDVEIADIGDRVSLLKNLTHNLHTEADSQNSVLRGMVRAREPRAAGTPFLVLELSCDA